MLFNQTVLYGRIASAFNQPNTPALRPPTDLIRLQNNSLADRPRVSGGYPQRTGAHKGCVKMHVADHPFCDGDILFPTYLRQPDFTTVPEKP